MITKLILNLYCRYLLLITLLCILSIDVTFAQLRMPNIDESVVFSVPHGIYNTPFMLNLSSSTRQGDIYYTIDGSLPDINNGFKYTAPIPINRTTVVRAVVIANGLRAMTTGTQSYIFPTDVIRQSNNPVGYPAMWGPYTAIPGTAIAHYGMNQELLSNPDFATAVVNSFYSIPIISIVTNRDNLFSHVNNEHTGGIYIFTGAPITNFTYAAGRGWERPASVEYLDVNKQSFQIDCGLRIQGGHSRRPEKSPKKSFLLNFDRMYGQSRLVYPIFGENAKTVFSEIVLRAGFGNSWVHHENAQRLRATYMEDIWTKDTQRAMGHPASHGTFVHLFLNGLYWGVYVVSERMDKHFAENYFGGDDDDYDVIKDYTEVADGTIDAWNRMMAMANAGLESNESYMLIQGRNPDGTINHTLESLVDVVSLSDYMLINFYGGNSDWDHHNWVAMRNRVNPGTGFKFVCWDAEMMFGSLTANILSRNNPNCPSRVYQQLIRNQAFRRLLADRIQRHLFNDGVLTPDSIIARWLKRRAVLEGPIMAESARWGNYRRDVHRYQTAGPFELYTKDRHWTPRNQVLINTFFPQRTNVFLGHLRNAGLFPAFDAPTFQIGGQRAVSMLVARGTQLSMTSSVGRIFYCLDGSDPINILTGELNALKAIEYTRPIVLNNSSVVVARVFHNSQWSAANKSNFLIPSQLKDIKLTEIHFDPLPSGAVQGSEFEFIELKNTGNATFHLGGFSISNGIDFTFPMETIFAPGTFIVLASNSNAFFSRYHFRPFGEYTGKLDNRGEHLLMRNNTGDTIFSIMYASSGSWPQQPAGGGHSLVPVNINFAGDPNHYSFWNVSSKTDGTPGSDDLIFTSVDGKLMPADNITMLNYPNPFVHESYFEFTIDNQSLVVLEIWNLAGQRIRLLLNEQMPSGKHNIRWNGEDNAGNIVPEGLYFYRFTIENNINRSSTVMKLMKVGK